MDRSLSRRSVQCAECNEGFSSPYNLKVHYFSKHPGKQCRQKGQTVLDFSAGVKRSRDESQESSVLSSSSSQVTSRKDAESPPAIASTNMNKTSATQVKPGNPSIKTESSSTRSSGSAHIIDQIQVLLNELKVEEKCPVDTQKLIETTVSNDIVESIRTC